MVKAIALVSGGTDSAVAAALALEQGMQLVFLHFDTVPLGNSRGREKTVKLAKQLGAKFKSRVKVVVVPHSEALFAIAGNCERKYACVLCRRMMLRIAGRIAERQGAKALLTGESIGQVASQTLSNLNAEHSAAGIPVIRPLLGMDKLQIEQLAKSFATFETSALPSACCCIPAKPATRASREIIEQEEKKIDTEKLVRAALEKTS